MTATTITAQDVMADLHAKAHELEQLSVALAGVCQRLDGTDTEPGVETRYTRFVDDFEIGLWEKHVNDGAKLPAEKLRVKLAHQAMDPVLYGQYFALVKSRERLTKRISALKSSVEASRSLLSAMKEGLV